MSIEGMIVLTLWLVHDLRANAFRVCREGSRPRYPSAGQAFSEYALNRLFELFQEHGRRRHGGRR
jgi:hypothetical protein